VLGRVNRKVAPRSELLVNHERPPCDSMIDRLMGSPHTSPVILGREECLADVAPLNRLPILHELVVALGGAFISSRLEFEVV
jgi:hypothetical protein